MPDNSAELEVKLVHPEDNLSDSNPRVFYIKATYPQVQNDINVPVQAVVSSAGDLAGGIPFPVMKKVTVEGFIAGMQAGDYPNSGSYSDHDYGFSREFEKAGDTWGPEFTSLATLHYDGRVYDGVVSTYNIGEQRDQNADRQYNLSFEFTVIDVYSRG